MSGRILPVLLGLLILGTSPPALSESKTFSCTATITIPAVLEVLLSEEELNVHLTPGATATTGLSLSVGTNCWPLELYLGLVSPPEAGSALAFAYRFGIETESLTIPLWIQIPAFALASPLDLPSPGWTTYTLFIRITAGENIVPGEYLQILRLTFRSTTGLVETRDIPIRVVAG